MLKGIDASGSLYDERFEHDACGIGFVAQKSGVRSHEVLALALTALRNHAHRGATAADGKSGDGAGVLTQLPYELMARELLRNGMQPPARGDLAVGMTFLPRFNLAHRERARTLLQETIAEYGLQTLMWRDVPANGDALGQWAQSLRPYIEQVLVARPADVATGEFERRLYLVRKRATQRVWAESISNFYLPSFSSLTVVYKGLFVAPQLPNFYRDLKDPDFRTAIAVFHQRYSTNTFPTWERAQPFRMVCHNGEINTLQGNIAWMKAREADLARSDVWGRDAKVLPPVIAPQGSDSAMLDNALDLLVQSGRDVRHALMMLVPRAWEHTSAVTPEQRAFYHYHACLQEPWDGPAALSFSDGRIVGSALDRNGLRPARFVILDDGLVIMSSEAGAAPVDEGRVVQKGRLRPGEMLAVDTAHGLIENDAAIVRRFVERQPYGEWLQKELTTLPQVMEWRRTRTAWPAATPKTPPSEVEMGRLLAAFGYTREELLVVLRPMWKEGQEAVGSMGDDTPAAALSAMPRPLFHYFKQRFAEVTNPPIDSLREDMVMSLSQRLGRRADLLSETAEAARLLEISSPILTDEETVALKGLEMRDVRPPAWHHLKPATLNMTWEASEGVDGLRPAVERLCAQAEAAVMAGCTLLILSDRAVDASRAPIPSLLATSAVHHHLIRAGERTHCSLIVESGEPREVHHCAALLGYGANAINPWLALAATADDVQKGGRHAAGAGAEEAQRHFIKALEKGILKVMSKMGISTLDSYCGAQIFEAVGVGDDLIQSAFAGTPNFRLNGVGYRDLAADVLAWRCNAYPEIAASIQAGGPPPAPWQRNGGNGHASAHTAAGEARRPAEAPPGPKLDSYGFYQARRGGEYHAFNPEVIRALHQAVGLAEGRAAELETGSGGAEPALAAAYRRFTELVERRPPTEPRDLLRVVIGVHPPLPLEEVEPAEEIVQRFSTAAMSYGALSGEAHETLTMAMNRLGAASNCGEGGEAEERYGTEREAKIKQVASGRFGVTPAYLTAAQELQIKMAQGSKPGEGGQLPGHKVSAEIARVRHTTPGVALISPPPHHDIYSIEDLAQLIFDLKQINPQAVVSVKLVAEAGVGTVAAGVVKGHADVVQISGCNGGTGASPLSSIKNAGAFWELGLAEAQQTLLINGLRERVRLRVDGGLKTGLDVVLAALLGADEFSFGTGALVAEGCKMARQCHENTCPVGIATQREDLRAKFVGTPESVMRYMVQVAEEVRSILARMGVRTLDEIIGHTEWLEQKALGAEAQHLDLLPLLWAPDTGHARRGRRVAEERLQQAHEDDTDAGEAVEAGTGSDTAGDGEPGLGERLATEALAALDRQGRAHLRYEIGNTDRTVGARLSGALARRHGNRGLAPGTIVVDLKGSAGQSFGAFGLRGLRLELEGEANDYVGKGLGGAEIVLRPPAAAQFVWHHNVILGNTALYGATSGELYAAGRAGERFAVRNSGARAVVEGLGDHGCEYMTGGVVVTLGKIGRNFGAGMTGGAAYLYEREPAQWRVEERVNGQLVALSRVSGAAQEQELRQLLERHWQRTGSPRAEAILADWEQQVRLFWRVAPRAQVALLAARDAAEETNTNEAVAAAEARR